MHGIVYQSESQFSELQPPRRLVPFSIRRHGMPGMGGDAGNRPDSALDLIIARLRKEARWYEEEVPVGHWVRFEARLGLAATRAERSWGLLFAELPGHTSRRRLVLHGEPDYLLDHSNAPVPVSWDGHDLVDLTRILDDALDEHAADWLSGYARVSVDTGDLPLVVASPLFVEYVSAPGQ